MEPPAYLELADSSLVAIRATAAAIAGRHCDPFERSAFEKVFGRLVNRLSTNRRKAILRFFTGTMGAPANLVPKVNINEILAWALSLYDGEGKYDGVVVGAPNGAVAHIASLMRFPFLTQHYLCAFKGKFAPDDSRAHFEDGIEDAREILANNPGLEAIVHYDPLHDRFLIVKENFIRLKLTTLPRAFKDFMLKRIKPGGTVVSVECTYPWLMYPVPCGEGDLFYQVGGLGDVSPQEYLDDSERLREYRKREGGDPDSGWGLKDCTPVEYGESEWGSVGALNQHLADFCAANGFRLIEISMPHPEGYSQLAFRAYKAALRLAQEKVRAVCFDCFTHIDPRLNLITHVPAIWLPFICRDSFRFAQKMANRLDRSCEIWQSLHPSFCDPVDVVSIQDWAGLFKGFKSYDLIGVDEARYPADLSTYLDYAPASKRKADLEKRPFALAVDADMLVKVIGDSPKNGDSGTGLTL